MNTEFMKKIQQRGISQYALSKRSGVPFSTINGLATGKHSINKCSAESVLKLASIIGVSPEELLDPSPVMEGISGEYLGWSYKWTNSSEGMVLSIKKGKCKDTIRTHYKLNIPRELHIYLCLTEMLIDRYIYEKEVGSECRKLIRIFTN